MVLARRGWVMTAGLLLAATSERPALAQDYGKAPIVLPAEIPTAPAPTTGVVLPPASAGAVTSSPAPENPSAGPSLGWERSNSNSGRCAESCRGCRANQAGRYEDPPLGTFLYAHGRTQVANGEAARMILYDYDFLPAANGLNPRGKEQLARIAALLPGNFFPVVIERTAAGPEIDEARRQAVLEELLRSPFPVPMERVIVGDPLSKGLRGVEAELIHQNMLLQTQTRGTLGSLGSNISFPTSPTGTGTPGAGTAPPVPR